MRNVIRILLLGMILTVFSVQAFCDPDPDPYPETVEIAGDVYTRVTINGEFYYEKDGVFYVYIPEMGEMLEAEISFP